MWQLKLLKVNLAYISVEIILTDLTDVVIKAPGFLHLQGLDMMSRGHLLADVVTIIGYSRYSFWRSGQIILKRCIIVP